MTPRLSVVMSVYNGERWLREAVDSILGQTFDDFELHVIDDGSTDDTPRILAGYRDPRLRVARQPRLGLTPSLNQGLRLAAAPLVARMDADDVSLRERFARQVAFLDAHPDVGLLGTGCHESTPSGEVLRTVRPPADDAGIRRALIRENPFIHSSIVMRREALDRAGLYDEGLPVAQDYDLWLRMSRVTRMANLPEPLVLRRLWPERVSRARDTDRLKTELTVRLRALRSGTYPPWCAVFLVKPLVALALPTGVRRFLRRARGSEPTSRATLAGKPTPIRVLELLVSADPGGGPKHVFDVARRLPREEWSVVVAAPPRGAFVERFREAGLEVVGIRLDRLDPRRLAAVVRLVRERGIQVIHSHGKGAGLYGRLAGWWTGVPALHTFHGIHYRKYGLGLGFLYLWLERRLSRLSHAVIHVSPSQARDALALHLAKAARSHIVVNGIDADEVRLLAERDPLSRDALGLSADAQVLGCVARFDRVKGLDILVEAFRRLAERYPRLALVLVGGGGGERGLRERVTRAGLGARVRFTGEVADAPRLFRALDLYVSASRGEGLPLGLLEAMACELPVVASRVTGHVDVVLDGVTGLLTRPEDPEDLAAALARLLDAPDLRRTMGRAGRERVEAHFGVEPMVSGLARLYREAAAAGRGGKLSLESRPKAG